MIPDWFRPSHTEQYEIESPLSLEDCWLVLEAWSPRDTYRGRLRRDGVPFSVSGVPEELTITSKTASDYRTGAIAKGSLSSSEQGAVLHLQGRTRIGWPWFSIISFIAIGQMFFREWFQAINMMILMVVSYGAITWQAFVDKRTIARVLVAETQATGVWINGSVVDDVAEPQLHASALGRIVLPPKRAIIRDTLVVLLIGMILSPIRNDVALGVVLQALVIVLTLELLLNFLVPGPPKTWLVIAIQCASLACFASAVWALSDSGLMIRSLAFATGAVLAIASMIWDYRRLHRFRITQSPPTTHRSDAAGMMGC